MRVLLIGINYAPEETGIAPYTTGLAEHLAGRGHAVTVVTGLPSYPQWRVHDGCRGVLFRREAVNRVDVRRRWHYVPRAQTAVHRGLYELTFLLTGLSALAVARPDAILGIVPSLSGGLVAALAARRFRVPYGLIFQDLLGRAATQSGLPGAGRAAHALRAAEGWVAQGAAAVGIIAEAYRPYLESLGVDPGRIERIRNWTHVAEPALDRATVRERLGLPGDAVVCLHAGNMGYKQGLEVVVECARLAAAADPRLLFVLVGDGNQRARLERLAASCRLANARFLPVQPREIFSSVLAAADLLLVTQRASVSDMAIPSKLTSYFAAGRPVVAAAARESETAREVLASGGGVLVRPGDPAALLEALRYLAAHRVRQAELGMGGAEYAREVLGSGRILAALETFVERVGVPRPLTREGCAAMIRAPLDENDDRPVDYRTRLYAHYVHGRDESLAPATLDGLRPRVPFLTKLIREHFPPDRDAAILDLGCGHGALAHVARTAGYRNILAVDRSPEQVAEARRLDIAAVREGDLMETLRSEPPESRDAVASVDVIEHFRKDEILLLIDAVWRVLKPGGKWIIHTPNAEAPFGSRMLFWDFTHELAFTRMSISQLLLASRFRRVGCFEDAPVPHGLRSGVRWILWKVIRAGWRFYMAVETGDAGGKHIFSQNFLVVAVK